MTIIPEKERAVVKELFAKQLKDEVRLVNFTQEFECEYCRETSELLQELSSLSQGKIKFETHDLVNHSDLARELRIDKIPATIIMHGKEGKSARGVRYFGIPSGYEFTSLLEDIIDTSRGSTRLSQASRQKVKTITKPVHIQVFVTPTCPYCPKAVRIAHQFAMENNLIEGDMIEAVEFPQLANKYEVMGVPKSVINDNTSFEGAMPEEHFLEQVMLALGEAPHS